MEEADLADVAEVDIVVDMKEEKTMCAVENMIEWFYAMMDHNWGCIRHMTSLAMNGTGYLRHKE